MPEKDYKFNPDTLQFEGKDITKTQKLLISGLSIFIGSIFIFLIIFVTYSFVYQVNNKKKFQNEFNLLENQYINLLERKQQNDQYLEELIEKDKKIYQAVFKTLPDNSIFDIQNPFAKFSNKDIKTIYNENYERLKRSQDVINNHKQLYKDVIRIAQSKEADDLESIPSIQPIYNQNLKYPVYGFGEKIDHVYKSLVFHPGIDIAAPEGTNVFVTAKGKVEQSGRKRGLGNRIVVDHGNGFKTVYAHLDKLLVYQGRNVKRGDRIGTVGLTGKTLIPHLHYEVEYKGKKINPINFFFMDLNPNDQEKIVQHSSRSGLSLD